MGLWLLRRLRQFLSFSRLVVSSAGSGFSGGSGLGALLSGDWGQLSMREAVRPFWYSCRVICRGNGRGLGWRIGPPGRSRPPPGPAQPHLDELEVGEGAHAEVGHVRGAGVELVVAAAHGGRDGVGALVVAQGGRAVQAADVGRGAGLCGDGGTGSAPRHRAGSRWVTAVPSPRWCCPKSCPVGVGDTEPSTEWWDRRVPECLVPACHLQRVPNWSLATASSSPRSGDSLLQHLLFPTAALKRAGGSAHAMGDAYPTPEAG